MLKVAYPTFGYEHFDAFNERLRNQGYYTSNLGDNMQSIALRRLFLEVGLTSEQIIGINRDNLSSYCGAPALFVFNGVFYNWCFPVPEQITPLFLGFCAHEQVIEAQQNYLKKYEPIGCRDTTTYEACLKFGIRAFVTGCVTLSIKPRVQSPIDGKVFVIFGERAGALPSSVLADMPRESYAKLEFIYQRIPQFVYPLSNKLQNSTEAYAESILNRIENEATLVITPLHHAATPSMGLGVPVIVCREKYDSRFSYLSSIVPIYTPDKFEEIDWNPQVANVANTREMIKGMILAKLRECGVL